MPKNNSNSAPVWAWAFVKLKYFNLSLALIITLFLGYKATQIKFNFSPDNIYLADDPAYQIYKSKFIKHFGDNAGFCIAGIEGDLNHPNTKKALFELHDRFENLKNISSVKSLKNSGDKLDLFVSKNLDAATLIIKLPLFHGQQKFKEQIAQDLTKILNKTALDYPNLKFYLTGPPIIQEATVSILKAEQLKFVPFVVILMALLLFLSFRNKRGVMLPFLATGAATIWALGFLVLIDHPLDIVNNSIIVLLLVISIADAVHIVSRFNDEFKKLKDKKFKNLAVAKTVQHMTIPCLLTTTTTALGFLSSVAADVGIIQSFGIDAGIGIMGAFVATMLIIPSCLAILPAPAIGVAVAPDLIRGPENKLNSHLLSIEIILEKITHFSLTFAKPILYLAFASAFMFGYFAKDIEANQTLVGELPQKNSAVKSLVFLDKYFFGTLSFDILFESQNNSNIFNTPEFLKQTAEIAADIEKIKPYPKIISYTQVLEGLEKELEQKLEQKSKPLYLWPNNKIEQLLMVLEFQEPEKLEEIKEDFYSSKNNQNIYRLSGLLKNVTTQELGQFRKLAENHLAQNQIPKIKTNLTGASLIMANALNHIISDMLSSLALAFVLIFIFMLILFRSFKFALIALFPNILPIIYTLGAMQMFGIHLRVATVIIFSMSLGIAIDACIHLLSRFKEEAGHRKFDNGLKLEKILKRTMSGSGRPVVYATFLLLTGFSALVFSEFFALRDFAILSSITLSSALLVDLFLLPALIFVVKPKM